MSNQYGFIVRGGPDQSRLLCLWDAAFRACCACDDGAPVGTEGYLSAFTFGDDLLSHFEAHGSPRGFNGPCGGAYVWLDFDGAGALDDARRVCAHLEALGADAGLLAFFSGGKGFHLGVPVAALGAVPSVAFSATAKAFALALATEAGGAGTFDGSIFDKARIFRAPNSRHAKSGLHKIALDPAALLSMREDSIRALAAEPQPFEVPDVPGVCNPLAQRWQTAIHAAGASQARRAEYKQAAASGNARLNPLTLRFIRDGANPGERASRCFQAAANLSECGAPSGLVFALLESAALESGMTPSEATRQIQCGAAHGGRAHD